MRKNTLVSRWRSPQFNPTVFGIKLVLLVFFPLSYPSQSLKTQQTVLDQPTNDGYDDAYFIGKWNEVEIRRGWPRLAGCLCVCRSTLANQSYNYCLLGVMRPAKMRHCVGLGYHVEHIRDTLDQVMWPHKSPPTKSARSHISFFLCRSLVWLVRQLSLLPVRQRVWPQILCELHATDTQLEAAGHGIVTPCWVL